MVNSDPASGLGEIIVYDLAVVGNGSVAVNAGIPTGGPGATADSVEEGGHGCQCCYAERGLAGRAHR